MIFALYPLLLTLFPVHSIFGENYKEIAPKFYFGAIFLVQIMTIIGVSSLSFLLKDWHLASLLFTFNFFSLLYANFVFLSILSPYKRSLKRVRSIFCLSYLSLCFLISFIVVAIKSFFPVLLVNKVITYFTVFVSFFVFLDMGNKLKSYYLKSEKMINLENIDISQPDIYHIVSDTHTGFARPYMCDDYFKQELEKRGFSIYLNVKSNYNYTNWSIPSMLNMDYIQNLLGENKDDVYHKNDSLAFYENNKFFSLLEERGYKLFRSVCHYYSHYFEKNNILDLDVILYNPIFEMMRFSSIYKVIKKRYKLEKNLYTNFSVDLIFGVLEKFEKLCKLKINRPKYCYTHFLAPHYPYLFDEYGNLLDKKDYFNDDYYFSYLKYVNKRMLATIDIILENMKPNSIIIIQGDHSTKHTEVYRNNTLFCVKFPPQYNPKCIKQNASLVNAFRGFSNEVFKTNYSYLEDKFYFCNPEEYKITPALMITNEEV